MKSKTIEISIRQDGGICANRAPFEGEVGHASQAGSMRRASGRERSRALLRPAFGLAIGMALMAEALTATAVAAAEPASEFDSLEERLLNAAVVRFDFDVAAEGVIEVSLRGSMDIEGDRVRLTASGTFAGEPVDLTLRADADRLGLGNGTNRTGVTRPERLEEALVIGFTRMGILHNLARLTEMAAPDHADGGVREWVTVAFETEVVEPDALSFDLFVAGEPAGSATLAIDALGRPVLRRQTVEFSAGQMRVVERYTAFSQEPFEDGGLPEGVPPP